jgi:hypothetical protein
MKSLVKKLKKQRNIKKCLNIITKNKKFQNLLLEVEVVDEALCMIR